MMGIRKVLVLLVVNPVSNLSNQIVQTPSKFHNQLQIVGGVGVVRAFGNQQHPARRVRGAKRTLEPSFDMDNQVVVATTARVQSSQPTISSVLNKLRAKRLHSSQP
ncbi:hypothetical protein ACH5RR_026440 [Cinchona calisaya]|uniref:Secreted protein n=1 Tax=Cinchona calisaya TaxID=153742 RepID=A0ABD2Z7L4_9GENT